MKGVAEQLGNRRDYTKGRTDRRDEGGKQGWGWKGWGGLWLWERASERRNWTRGRAENLGKLLLVALATASAKAVAVALATATLTALASAVPLDPCPAAMQSHTFQIAKPYISDCKAIHSNMSSSHEQTVYQPTWQLSGLTGDAITVITKGAGQC